MISDCYFYGLTLLYKRLKHGSERDATSFLEYIYAEPLITISKRIISHCCLSTFQSKYTTLIDTISDRGALYTLEGK